MDNKERYDKLVKCDKVLSDIMGDLVTAESWYMDANNDEEDDIAKAIDQIWKDVKNVRLKVNKFAETVKPVKKIRVWETVTFYKDVEVPLDEDTEAWLADHE